MHLINTFSRLLASGLTFVVYITHCVTSLLKVTQTFITNLQTRYSDSSALKMCIKFANLFQCIPIKIIYKPVEKSLIVSVIDFKSMKSLNRKSVVALVLQILLLCQCIYSTRKESDLTRNIEDIIVAWFSLALLTTVNFLMTMLIQNSIELVKYFNGILQFQEKHPLIKQHKSTITEKLNRLFALMILFTEMFYSPIFLIGFHYKNACKPSLIGSYFLKACRSDSKYERESLLNFVWNLALNITVVLSNVWVWYVPMIAATFATAAIMCLAPILLGNAYVA